MKNRFSFNLLRQISVGMLLIFFLSGSISVLAQDRPPAGDELKPFLMLEKPGTKHRIRYYVGDEIEFKQKDQKKFIQATIVQFSDTSFFINDYIEVPIRTVSDLADRSKVKGIHRMARNTLFVIPVFFVFSAANNLFNTGNTPVIDPEVYTLSAIFLGVSGLGYLYNGRRYRLKNQWRIIIVRL